MTSDIRYALRLMRATPLLTSVLVLTMTLGIGASTALFSVVYGVLFRPLPFYEPDRLMRSARGARTRRESISIRYRTTTSRTSNGRAQSSSTSRCPCTGRST